MKILSLSYYDMPSHLQTCLLYLSTYPEDSYIDKDKLIWKWIAEGFVLAKQEERLFELGERYFNDLINRSMIQAVDEESNGRVSGCRVHDIVLDLLHKFSFEENFIAILDGNAEAISPPSNVRRFAFHNRTGDERGSSEAKVIQMPKIRSYTAFGCHINNNWVDFSCFRLLRVLDIIKCIFQEGCHLEHLGDLLHLRYLGIECGPSNPKLSRQITNLKLLQTLVLYGTEAVRVSIVLPTQLLCLHADGSVPDGIGKLTSLEQLSIVGDAKILLNELGSLGELRELIINDRNYMEQSTQIDFFVALSNLQKIEKIDFYTHYARVDTAMWEAAGFVLPRSLRDLKMWTRFSTLPSCINSLLLPNLSRLELKVNTMDEQGMKHLARLPALSCLILDIESGFPAISINAGSGGYFQQLMYLEINAMVQFQQCNKEDSSISFYKWNGKGAMSFASGNSNSSKNVPSALMPKLEMMLRLRVSLGDFSNIGLEYLHALRELTVSFFRDGICAEDLEAASAALTNVCKVHPNHPSLILNGITVKIVDKQDKEDEKQQQEGQLASQTADMDLGKLSKDALKSLPI